MAATINDKGLFQPVGAARVRVSSADTISDFLNSKLVDDDSTIATTILNPGGNEQLQIATA